VRWTNYETGVKFLLNAVYQELLKSVHFDRETHFTYLLGNCTPSHIYITVNFTRLSVTTEVGDIWAPYLRLARRGRCTESIPELETVKAKFHYAIWFEAGSKLVAGMQRAEIWPII